MRIYESGYAFMLPVYAVNRFLFMTIRTTYHSLGWTLYRLTTLPSMMFSLYYVSSLIFASSFFSTLPAVECSNQQRNEEFLILWPWELWNNTNFASKLINQFAP
ncbi:uncharacterized protein EDB93DRAFT_771968 [Suillus bovinus]|uniref:uncharacterized protein n=1 Tax=Suillus bovinus TaxID=48563 RepID=UPI001B85BE91|nr:uncharacterized protein EDB93DRAFT_771968 [Suillus bovinus]KAG2136956.1 hypothetical protein EDB93DRAFT_771968 [Suillus bovinus]